MKWIFRLVLPVIIVLVLLVALCIGAIVIAIVQQEAEIDGDNAGGISVPITITGTVRGADIALEIEGTGIHIEGIKGEITGAAGRPSAARAFTASNGGGGGKAEMEIPSPPAKLTWFSHMAQYNQSLYKIHLDHNSAQYKFNVNCEDDDEGFRRYGDAYLVALGSYYGSKVGEKYTLTFTQDDGTELVISAVRGDTKRDSETDDKHQYHKWADSGHTKSGDCSVVEFIMSANNPSKNDKIINKKFGTLKSISKGNMSATLSGTITGEDIDIKGTADDLPITAKGTVKDGNILAYGVYGTEGAGITGGAYPGEPITDEDYGKLLAVAQAELGKPYVFGSNGPDSWDCSSFTRHCYKTLGKNISRTAAAQQAECAAVSIEDRKPGDLIFFQGTYKSGVSHVGIYIGANKMIHAGSSSGVSYASVDGTYYVQHFHSYGRPK